MVIKTENNKQSTIDFTNARETEADDERIASIKEVKEANEALILEAEGKLEVIKRIVQATTKEIQWVNESDERYFIDNANPCVENMNQFYN